MTINNNGAPWGTAPVPENIDGEQAEVMFYLNTVFANLAMGVDAIMQVAIEVAGSASDRDRNINRQREAARYLGSAWWRVRDAVCEATTPEGDEA